MSDEATLAALKNTQSHPGCEAEATLDKGEGTVTKPAVTSRVQTYISANSYNLSLNNVKLQLK